MDGDMVRTSQERTTEGATVRIGRGPGVLGWLAGLVVAVVAVAVLVVALAAVHLLPQLRNPFGESTSVRSQPVLLKSITSLSRYQAASGSFQDVNFSQLKGSAIQVSGDHTGVTVKLPPAQLEPAVLNVRQSYAFAQQQGLLNRVGTFFSGNPTSEQQLYIVAQQKIQAAARRSVLLADAQRNTVSMLTGMLRSLGFQRVTVTFTAPAGTR